MLKEWSDRSLRKRSPTREYLLAAFAVSFILALAIGFLSAWL